MLSDERRPFRCDRLLLRRTADTPPKQYDILPDKSALPRRRLDRLRGSFCSLLYLFTRCRQRCGIHL